MKRFLATLAALAALCVSAHAGMVVGSGSTPGGGTTACVGFGGDTEGTDCNYASAPETATAYISGNSTTDTYLWTSTVNGTVSRIKVYWSAAGTATAYKAVWYNGTTYKCDTTVTPAGDNQWQWVDMSGCANKTFSIGDSIYFGVALQNTTSTVSIGRNDVASGGKFYRDLSHYLPNPATWTNTATRQPCFILEYTY